MKESEIKKSILDLLENIGIWAWGAYNGPEIHGQRRWAKTKTPGKPDIMGVLPDGKALHIEVKKPGHKTDKLHLKRQTDWIDKVNARNGVGFFAESTKDVFEELVKRKYVEVPWVEK